MTETIENNPDMLQETPVEDAVQLSSLEGIPEHQYASHVRQLKETEMERIGRVISISGPQVSNEASEELRALYELAASLNRKTILTGRIEGVERSSDGAPRAVLHHGGFKIVIPYFEVIQKPKDYRDMDPNEVHHYLLSKRLGAEIEYVVKGIDQEARIAVASRNEAMALRRRQFYIDADKRGTPTLAVGMIAEARIISVIRTGIFVELFGAETFIHQTELSYTRLIDTALHFRTGERVLVVIRSLEVEDPDHITLSLSVKRTKPNPYENLSERFSVGNNYIGTVTSVNFNGVCVSLDAGVDCLCHLPVRGFPMIGARATIRLVGVNDEEKWIRGVIIHSSYQP